MIALSRSPSQFNHSKYTSYYSTTRRCCILRHPLAIATLAGSRHFDRRLFDDSKVRLMMPSIAKIKNGIPEHVAKECSC